MQKALILLLFFFTSILSAQKFSHADSLKGGSPPERTAFDVHYYNINLLFDIEKRSISGFVDIYFNVVKDGVTKMQIDLYKNFQILGILDANGNEMEYKRDGNAIFVNRKVLSVKGESSKIRINYEGNPEVALNSPWESGFVFKKDNKGRPWIAVACQGTGSSIWWPSKDTQSDEADSVEISVRIPTASDLVVVSNGNLRSKFELDGATTYTWFVSYPINNYDVSINIGKYVNFNEKYKGVEATYDLDYWVLDYNLETAKKHFTQVKGMMDAFEKKLGPYPFPKDGFALVETPYLGMEHQSGIAYGNKYLPGYLGVERSGLPLGFDFIIIHETGHEYWGNSLTTADIADMWVHEGFCTYSEALYVEEIYGPDTALMYCNAWKLLVSNDEPVIGPYGVHREGSGDMYNKGALMLHTLRWLVNDDKKWFATIKGLQKDFRFQIVTGDQVIQYMNKKLGKDYTWLFDQYLKFAEPPILKYELTEAGADLEVNIYWKNVSPQFVLPLSINIGGGKCKSYTITSTPQKITLKNLTKKDFWVDDQHAYYLVK
jgi:aminopeptidase N